MGGRVGLKVGRRSEASASASADAVPRCRSRGVGIGDEQTTEAREKGVWQFQVVVARDVGDGQREGRVTGSQLVPVSLCNPTDRCSLFLWSAGALVVNCCLWVSPLLILGFCQLRALKTGTFSCPRASCVLQVQGRLVCPKSFSFSVVTLTSPRSPLQEHSMCSWQGFRSCNRIQVGALQWSVGWGADACFY